MSQAEPYDLGYVRVTSQRNVRFEQVWIKIILNNFFETVS